MDGRANESLLALRRRGDGCAACSVHRGGGRNRGGGRHQLARGRGGGGRGQAASGSSSSLLATGKRPLEDPFFSDRGPPPRQQWQANNSGGAGEDGSGERAGVAELPEKVQMSGLQVKLPSFRDRLSARRFGGILICTCCPWLSRLLNHLLGLSDLLLVLFVQNSLPPLPWVRSITHPLCFVGSVWVRKRRHGR